MHWWFLFVLKHVPIRVLHVLNSDDFHVVQTFYLICSILSATWRRYCSLDYCPYIFYMAYNLRVYCRSDMCQHMLHMVCNLRVPSCSSNYMIDILFMFRWFFLLSQYHFMLQIKHKLRVLLLFKHVVLHILHFLYSGRFSLAGVSVKFSYKTDNWSWMRRTAPELWRSVLLRKEWEVTEEL
jgi:hypothetical protein